MGTVESGFMTKDLALCIHKSKYVVTVWIVCALLQLLTAAMMITTTTLPGWSASTT